jgi:hypothetical protein
MARVPGAASRCSMHTWLMVIQLVIVAGLIAST